MAPIKRKTRKIKDKLKKNIFFGGREIKRKKAKIRKIYENQRKTRKTQNKTENNQKNQEKHKKKKLRKTTYHLPPINCHIPPTLVFLCFFLVLSRVVLI